MVIQIGKVQNDLVCHKLRKLKSGPSMPSIASRTKAQLSLQNEVLQWLNGEDMVFHNMRRIA